MTFLDASIRRGQTVKRFVLLAPLVFAAGWIIGGYLTVAALAHLAERGERVY